MRMPPTMESRYSRLAVLGVRATKAMSKKYIPGGTQLMRRVLPRRAVFWLIYRINHWENEESFSGPGPQSRQPAMCGTSFPGCWRSTALPRCSMRHAATFTG